MIDSEELLIADEERHAIFFDFVVEFFENGDLGWWEGYLSIGCFDVILGESFEVHFFCNVIAGIFAFFSVVEFDFIDFTYMSCSLP